MCIRDRLYAAGGLILAFTLGLLQAQWTYTGYARGCNRGMAEVEADYYLILNPDIVVQPGALDRLLEFADAHPRAGIVGPQLLNEDGSLQESCRRFYTCLLYTSRCV